MITLHKVPSPNPISADPVVMPAAGAQSIDQEPMVVNSAPHDPVREERRTKLRKMRKQFMTATGEKSWPTFTNPCAAMRWIASRPYQSELIYLIVCGDQFMKVGRTNDPFVRMKKLQTGCPLPMDLVGFIGGSRSMELLLQAHLIKAKLLHRSEWFRYDEKFVQAFKACSASLQP